MKWEWNRRLHLLRLLTGKAKCLVFKDNLMAYEVLLECLCLMVSMSTFFPRAPSVSFSSLFKFIEKDIMEDAKENTIEDVLKADLAQLIYIISWISLKNPKGVRGKSCAEFIPPETKTLVCGLKLAFVLSSHVPELFQKISKLLAIIYMRPCTLSASSRAPSQNQWAAFFHQATLGTNLNYDFSSHLVKVSDRSSWSSSHVLRVAPESVKDLENFVLDFFRHLGPATIVGISLFEDGYCSLLRELLSYGASTHAWLMFSRIPSTREPVVVLLPIHSIAGRSEGVEDPLFDKPGNCPWGKTTIIDKVAPIFRTIVNFTNIDATNMSSILRWAWLRTLDQWLKDLLTDMEDNWFGEWKYMLLGESKDEMLSGCYVGGRQYLSPLDESPVIFVASLFAKRSTSEKRKPVILVLDADIQMIPWESLPVLRYEEVYRMPSISSIIYTYSRCSELPEIDPRDTFYLADPLREIRSIPSLVGGCFKRHHFKGKYWKLPDMNELIRALQCHDLFTYVGHGDGLRYYPQKYMVNLPKCSAAFLMGCKTGLLKLKGSYTPEGAPLYYFFGGSPVVIGNLWDVLVDQSLRLVETIFDEWISTLGCKACSSACGVVYMQKILGP